MFKKLMMIIVCFFMLTCVGYAENLLYSADKTADAIISTTRVNFFGMIVIDDGTTDVTVEIYDGTDATGTLIVQSLTFVANSDNPNHVLSFDPPIVCYDGMFVDITTSGTTSYKVYYNRSNR
ncbi:MAG: hypothetical protein PF440_04675 [Thiomicrorhabdus sp.]|jgi:hypothetical protein|nr:hypothetical protein [Thiomicrorhabdus sp.]